MPARTPASAASTGASAKTMFGLLPPSSSETGARRAPAARRDLLPGRLAAGERDLGDAGMLDERAPGLARAGDDVEDAGREAGLLGEAQRLDHAGGRVLGRLDDDRVAGRERRPERVHRQQHRRVPGDDDPDDAERLAQRVVEDARAVERDDAPLDLVREPAEVVEPLRDHPELREHLLVELAVVGDLDRGDLLRAVGDEIGEAHHQPAAARRRRARASARPRRRRGRRARRGRRPRRRPARPRPTAWPVVGLIASNVSPEAASTSSPPMYSRSASCPVHSSHASRGGRVAEHVRRIDPLVDAADERESAQPRVGDPLQARIDEAARAEDAERAASGRAARSGRPRP